MLRLATSFATSLAPALAGGAEPSRAPPFGRLGDVAMLVAQGASRGLAELGRLGAWLAAKTGYPALLLTAVVLVVGIRLAKKVGRIALEVALAVALLVALQHLGVVRW